MAQPRRHYALEFLILRLVLLGTAAVLLVAGLIWCLVPAAPIPAQASAKAPVSALPKSTTTPGRIEAPANVAAPTKPAASFAATPSATAAGDSTDPQTNLHTALADIARLYRLGDRPLLWKTYETPDDWAKNGAAEVEGLKNPTPGADDPKNITMMKDLDEAIAKSYEDLATQTPTLNTAGDEASYLQTIRLEDGTPFTQPIMLVRLNGKWYMKSPTEN